MSVEYCNPTIKEIADDIVAILIKKNFVIQRYNAYSTDSVYLKLDYGVANTIRISDHPGKNYLKYRYNVIVDGEVNITEDEYVRYYYNQDTISHLINQILFDKMAKEQKYGKTYYRNIMHKNKIEKKHEKGFWTQAVLVHDPYFMSE